VTDPVVVAAGDAPLLVVVLVVGRVVVPTAAVRLEDRALVGEREVEEVGASVPAEGELADEVGDAVGDEEAPGLHFERRPRWVRRIQLVEEPAHRGDARPSSLAEAVEVRTQRGH